MFSQHPHRRYNPLAREWVLVSPQRAQRPWQGQVERVAVPAALPYDPSCYLCPGNSRASGQVNPRYSSTFVFDNDFPALYADVPAAEFREKRLLLARSEQGVCRVVCFSPDHSLTLSRMSPGDVGRVVDTWTGQYIDLARQDGIAAVQIFENRGEMMGASNSHPHCQIWATGSVPDEVAKEDAAQREYQAAEGSCLLCDYGALERKAKERLVVLSEHFTALVPFWAVWPFELLLLPTRHTTGLDELNAAERSDLAAILGEITRRYDNLFQVPFPYTMGLHQRPTDGVAYPHYHYHAHFYPPLLRSATVRKFMVGFEMLGNPQRDITPEEAALRLRSSSAEIE